MLSGVVISRHDDKSMSFMSRHAAHVMIRWDRVEPGTESSVNLTNEIRGV